MRRIDPKEISLRPFAALDDDWALLASGADKPNLMTVSWGGFGTLWNRPVVTVYVRPTRFSYGLLNGHPEFTLNFMPDSRRDALELCGATSGIDTDKWAAAKLTPLAPESVKVPRVAEAGLSFECRILAAFDFDPARFFDKTILEQYPGKDFHRAFVGQVLAAFAA